MPETPTKEAKLNSADKLLATAPYSRTFGEKWKQNQATQLLGFACLIFAVGAGFLVYRQNKFVPVGFPDGDSIETVMAASATNSSKPADAASIVVVGAKDNGGVIRVAIYDSAEGFNDPASAVLRTTLRINDGEGRTWTSVDTLPESFAVAVFQDENGNGELDRNRLGIPMERYGFSNDARGLTGPPSFDNAKIDRPKVGQSINISIR